MAQRPNILYLHSHDTGRYVRPYGYDVPTPHLQQLADEGVRFRQTFCAAPTCSPSRASLLTGTYPHEAGMTGLAHRGWRLNDYDQHIIHTLRQADYHAALVGTQHIIDGAHVEQIGYDQARPGGATEARTQAAVDFLTHAPPQPFFLSVFRRPTVRSLSLRKTPDPPVRPTRCRIRRRPGGTWRPLKPRRGSSMRTTGGFCARWTGLTSPRRRSSSAPPTTASLSPA